jgi:hypothetical protein
MLITKEVKMNITNRNISFYRNKGYSCLRGNSIIVKVEDLPEGSNYPVEVKCDFCNDEIVEKEYYRYLEERKIINMDCCRNGKCKGIKQRLITRKPLDLVIKQIELLDYKFINIVDEYINSKSSLILECPNKHQLSYVINAFFGGRRCSICAGSYQADHDFEEVFNYFESQNCILLETEYISMKTPLNYICSCGNPGKTSYYDFLQGHRCSVCGGNKKYTHQEVYDIFKTNNCELLSKEYINNHSLLKYVCECGNESEIILSNFLRGVRCEKCYRENNKGENHHHWNPNLTEEERIIKRNYDEYKNWRTSVFERDNYTCQCCLDKKGGNLNAHHLDGYNWCKEKRLDIDNGITLCKDCHGEFHTMYGYGNNTYIQFKEFMKYKEINNYEQCTSS